MNSTSIGAKRNLWWVRVAMAICFFEAVVQAGCGRQIGSDGYWHWTTSDPSIRPKKSADERVENGDAFDKAVFDIDQGATLVVPDDAQVERTEHAGRVEIYMKKTLETGFHGNATIRTVRKEMGCAKKAEGTKVVIGTFGEWGNFEGGRRLNVLLRVPAGTDVEPRKGLSGQLRGTWRTSTDPPDRDEIKPGANGWTAIPDEPDPSQMAKALGKPE